MKIISVLHIVFLCFISLSVSSQEIWNLEKCIAYADSNNLNLKSKQLDLLIVDIQKKQAKLNILFTVNMGGTHGYNWGQSIDPFTNQFASDRVRTNNFYAGSSWDIFTGLQNYYLRQQNDLTYQITEQEIEIKRRNLKIDITAAYMQIILNHYLIEASEKQVEYAIKSADLSRERFKNGYSTHYDVLSMSSQLTIDSSVFIRAKNNEEYSLLLLMQLLNLNDSIDVEIPDITTLEQGKLEIESGHFLKNAEFKLAEKQTALQEYQLKMSKARLLPKLSINSSIGSGYSGNSKMLVGSEFFTKSFDVQMRENFYQSAVLTLSVPIFNHGRVHSEIKIAEVRLTKTKLEQEIMITALQNQVSQLQNEINNESLSVKALKRSFQASEERFEAASEQYGAGKMNVQNYLDLRNTLFKIQAEYYTSLITLRFKEKMLMEMYQR